MGAKRRRAGGGKKWAFVQNRSVQNRPAGVCEQSRTMRIPYHNKADGFMAGLVLALNQVKFCELHGCQPVVVWGAFPACKYAGVRYPGRTPFFEASRGPNAFLYYFQPVCSTPAAQLGAPALSCEQREQIHRVLPWGVRTYYYGSGLGADLNGTSSRYDEAWYAAQRHEGARLVKTYLRLQAPLASRLEQLSGEILQRSDPQTLQQSTTRANHLTRLHSIPTQPILGVHLRGTDKGKYATAGSGRQVTPSEYLPYVRAYLARHPNASVFVATDSPSFLAEVLSRWPRGRVRYRTDVLRKESNVAFSSDKLSNFRKGEEVLLDMLLLSRCDFLLHAASGVAEFAIYFNPTLHRNSVHLQYTEQRQHPWWLNAPHDDSSIATGPSDVATVGGVAGQRRRSKHMKSRRTSSRKRKHHPRDHAGQDAS